MLDSRSFFEEILSAESTVFQHEAWSRGILENILTHFSIQHQESFFYCFKDKKLQVIWTRCERETGVGSYIFIAIFLEGKMLVYAILFELLKEAELLRIATLEAFRQQGLAGALLSCIQQKFGFLKIQLEVRAGNEIAQSFYEQRGFVFQTIRKNYYDHPNEDAKLYVWLA